MFFDCAAAAFLVYKTKNNRISFWNVVYAYIMHIYHTYINVNKCLE